jgi:hypothetical protein
MLRKQKPAKKIQIMCNRYQALSKRNAFLYHIFQQLANHLPTTCGNLLTYLPHILTPLLPLCFTPIFRMIFACPKFSQKENISLNEKY